MAKLYKEKTVQNKGEIPTIAGNGAPPLHSETGSAEER